MVDCREDFWRPVAECLAAFHGHNRRRANQEVKDYLAKLVTKVNKSEFELIYHEEPFTIACEIAGKSLDISAFADVYESILMKASK